MTGEGCHPERGPAPHTLSSRTRTRRGRGGIFPNTTCPPRYAHPVGSYFVYILSSRGRVLYVGVTNDLRRRVLEHKAHLVPGFTQRYNVDRLVYFEATANVQAALAREKEIKGWRREKKVALIEAENPEWRDLAEDVSAG